MNAAQIVGVACLAGVLGAVAGGVVSVFASGEPARNDRAVFDRLDELARGVDSLRSAAQDGRDGVADLQERLIAVELELSRRAAAPSLPTSEAPGGIRVEGSEPTAVVRRSIDDVSVRLHDMETAAARMAEHAKALQQNFAKSMELRALPEDERWARIAEELGLNSVQVDELKAAQTTLQEGMKAAITQETKTTDSGAEFSFRQVDGEKMREARKAFDDRVTTVLNDEQKKAWTDGGYQRAVGGGRGAMVFSSGVRVRSSGGDGSDSPGSGAIIIEAGSIGD